MRVTVRRPGVSTQAFIKVKKMARLGRVKLAGAAPTIASHAAACSSCWDATITPPGPRYKTADQSVYGGYPMAGRSTNRADAERRAAQRRIARALAQVGFALPGSVSVRHYRCGKPNCACHAEPPRLHGPSIQWTRKVNAKTVNRVLTPEQWEDYKAWFEAARALRALVAELEALSLEILEEDDRWGRSPQAANTS